MKHPKVLYRRTKESDLLESYKLILISANDLRRKHRLKTYPIRITEHDSLLSHLLKTDPEGSFVAVDRKGKIVGFTMSQMRDDEWFLSYLFVLPEYQSKGVGQKLLAKAMHYGTVNDCSRRALATFGYNSQAVALYSKLGMSPQRAIVSMVRVFEKKEKPRFIKIDSPLRIEKIETERLINKLTSLDRKARHVARPEEHFYWLDSKNHQVLAFYDRSILAGYSVLFDKWGLVGPIVAAKPQYLTKILVQSANFALKQGQKKQVVFLHGEHAEAVKTLLAAGFRVSEVDLQMATEKFSDPAVYIPGHLAHY